jgi:hypothetical protein
VLGHSGFPLPTGFLAVRSVAAVDSHSVVHSVPVHTPVGVVHLSSAVPFALVDIVVLQVDRIHMADSVDSEDMKVTSLAARPIVLVEEVHTDYME